MNSKSILVLFLFLIWGSGSTYWYVCKIKGFCQQQTTQSNVVDKTENEQTTIPVKKVAHSLIYFNRDNFEPVINDSLQWQAEVKSIAQLQAEGKKLHIEATYYAGEQNKSTFDNLGIARADALKNLLSKSIDTSLIVTKAKLMSDSMQIPSYIEYDKNWIKWFIDNDFVKEQDKKTLVHFPYNSTQAIKNEAILSYLDEVNENLKKHPELNILIVGHTDDSGSGASNKILGLKRAKRIKNWLLKKGISADRIIIKSEGESQPIADNETEEGRRQNRRVEISYIKK